MYIFATFTAIAALIAAWSTYEARQMQPLVQGAAAQAQAQALNMAEYRASVIDYLNSVNPSFEGSIPAAQLPGIAHYAATGLWNNYVEGNTIVVYAIAPTAAGLPSFMTLLAQGSVLAGVAQSGYLIPPGAPGVAVPLPTGIANAIANGTPVWMAEISRG